MTVLEQIAAVLDAKHVHGYRGYALTRGNKFAQLDNAVLSTPTGIFSQATDHLPPHPSAALTQAVRGVAQRGKAILDYVHLSMKGSGPTDQFERELFLGIKDALATGVHPVTDRLFVRIVLGLPPGSSEPFDPEAFIRRLIAGVGAPGKLSACVLYHNFSLPSRTVPVQGSTWNHGKFVAADGQHLMTGGHNWWDVYLGQQPVFDLSVQLEGPVAQDAHQFTNFLIKEAMKGGIPPFKMMKDGKIGDDLNPFIEPFVPPPTQTGSVDVLSVAQLGNLGGAHKTNPSLDAMHWAFRRATREINLSQMSIGSPRCEPLSMEFARSFSCGGVELFNVKSPTDKYSRYYDYNLMLFIAMALLRKTNVNIVISNSQNVGDFEGDGPDSIYRAIGYCLMKFGNKTDAVATIRNHLKVKVIMTHGTIPWTSAPHLNKSNHAKFWSVDETCYVGSHNVYPSAARTGLLTAHLAEYGVIMSDAVSHERIMREYFTPLWGHSHLGDFNPDWIA
ncbi:hypothetical protein [Sphingomonas sp. SUN039]|uniref:hypothetical protein n=1 Tax=Sphingomonas sp. SUN039 TaxID=2937787 RepID=UPI00216494D2|nr:hypothetical protein [Sphingomonas sp. SUN039]UVO52734.1 hypothetical protein M0209_00805 [Sphingomonas sp. SUN039]